MRSNRVLGIRRPGVIRTFAFAGTLGILAMLAPQAWAAEKVDGKECADRAYPRGDHWICRAKDGSIAEGKKESIAAVSGAGQGAPMPHESMSFDVRAAPAGRPPHEIKSPRDAATGQANAFAAGNCGNTTAVPAVQKIRESSPRVKCANSNLTITRDTDVATPKQADGHR